MHPPRSKRALIWPQWLMKNPGFGREAYGLLESLTKMVGKSAWNVEHPRVWVAVLVFFFHPFPDYWAE